MNEKKRKEFVLNTCLGIVEVCKNKKGEIKLSDVVYVFMLIIDDFFELFSEENKIEKSVLYSKLILHMTKTFLNKEENEA